MIRKLNEAEINELILSISMLAQDKFANSDGLLIYRLLLDLIAFEYDLRFITELIINAFEFSDFENELNLILEKENSKKDT